MKLILLLLCSLLITASNDFISSSDLQGVGDKSVSHTWVLLLCVWKVIPLSSVELIV